MADIEPQEAMGQGGAVLVGGGEGARDDETATSVSGDDTMDTVVGHDTAVLVQSMKPRGKMRRKTAPQRHNVATHCLGPHQSPR
jgi:hypothetical protein